ncbi:MAG: hypothetical protein NTY02_14090 [Acidobacteria bacterium]|nr:hypothetical protein [Acidobacteriota bacterium]
MQGLWRSLICAAALAATVGVGVATAQTVVVRNAPAGATIELVLNGTSVATAAADSAGEARLTVQPQAGAAAADRDVRMLVDRCGTTFRIVIVERGFDTPAIPSACDRREVTGLYLMRPITNFVVDVAPSTPDLWLRQGEVPNEWMTSERAPDSGSGSRRRSFSPVNTGIELFGGPTFIDFSHYAARACGSSVPACTSDAYRLGPTIGGTYWLRPFMGFEGSYVKGGQTTVAGSGSDFRFTSSLDFSVVNIVGKVGLPVGLVRFYGQGGTTYHNATLTEYQVVDDKAITVDGVTLTIPGGTHTLVGETSGWGWTFGGGAEMWLAGPMAVYAEAGMSWLRGEGQTTGSSALDDRIKYIGFGLRYHPGRR